jgi:hypothetical protein
MRTKDEGGTVFTVCDECWDRRNPKAPPAPSVSPPEVERLTRELAEARAVLAQTEREKLANFHLYLRTRDERDAVQAQFAAYRQGVDVAREEMSKELEAAEREREEARDGRAQERELLKRLALATEALMCSPALDMRRHVSPEYRAASDVLGDALRIVRPEGESDAASDATAGAGPVCSSCNDTHVQQRETGDVMCTRCPRPCESCRGAGQYPYCDTTPCTCTCHRATAGAARDKAVTADEKCHACGVVTDHWVQLVGEPLRCTYCLAKALEAARSWELEA